MQFLNLHGSTTGKGKQVTTNALNRVVTTAKEKGQRWEKKGAALGNANLGMFPRKKKKGGHGCGSEMSRSWSVHPWVYAGCVPWPSEPRGA